MLAFLPTPLKYVLAILFLAGNTLLWFIPLSLITIAKLALPIPAWRRACSRALVGIAEQWIAGNNAMLAALTRTRWEFTGLEQLRIDAWYLIVCNHVSTVDIPVLQRAFTRRIPFIKFFIKQELLWVPLLGAAWWALDFPFMRRYSREELAKRPELRGKDLETTRRACARFRHTPTTILNFLEGTRFTTEKHAAQSSPYRHLLRPKAGGVSFVLGAMGEMFTSMLNVTVVYPEYSGRHPGLGDLLSGRVRRVIVHVEEVAIPPAFINGDYSNDPVFREQFQSWIHELWREKDALIARLTAAPDLAAGAHANRE